ncbi:MAG: plasmid stabilization protein [Xanthomonadaceae bacterium]|nr:plasmid stabilization protein [Xanthomonadaceae bacterium]
MSHRLRLTRAAAEDLQRRFDFLAEQDLALAMQARAAITQASDFLITFPFACRKADRSRPWLREMVISFGHAGYVALYEIDDDETVTILAVRHQREDDRY